MKDALCGSSPVSCAILVVSLLYSSAVATSSWKQTIVDDRDVTVTERNNGQTIPIPLHGTLVVGLKSQLGTGYGWQVLKIEGRRLKLLGEPELESSPAGRPGEVEHQVFRFQALRTGISTLVLGYVRPWEKNVQPSKTFRLKVRVR